MAKESKSARSKKAKAAWARKKRDARAAGHKTYKGPGGKSLPTGLESKPKRAKKSSKKARAAKKEQYRGGTGIRPPKRAKRKSGSKKPKQAKRPAKRSGAKSVRTVVVKVPGKTRKVYLTAAEKRKGPKKGRRHSEHRRHHYSMENPLTGMEIVSGGLAMLFGLAVADISDRYWATHSLTATTSGTTTSYSDTGAMATTAAASTTTGTTTGGAGPFGMTPGYVNTTAGTAGLKNGAAVLAPMNLTRWLSGGVLAAAPFAAAVFVKNTTVRTGLQMFGFGVIARIGGKALVDVFAQLLGNTTYGQQMYVNELAAAAQWQAAQGQTVTISLPNIGTTVPVQGAGAATGIAHPQRAGVGGCSGCQNCVQGRPCGKTPPGMPAPPPAAPLPESTESAVVTASGPASMVDQLVAAVPALATSSLGAPPNGQRRNPYNWANGGNE
jgi:hypothetical protein